MQPALHLRDVSLRTGARLRLDGISLALAQGECLAVIGASGAGKSSLASLLLGLAQGEIDGQLDVLGHAVTRLPAPQLDALRGRGAVMVPQNLADCLNPQMTVAAHAIESLRRCGAPRRGLAAQAREALLRANVPAHLHARRCATLSGGETQRVFMALALLPRPRLLVLDEPTSAIDAQARREMLAQIAAVAPRTAILLISHDLDVVQRLAQRVAVMAQGRIVEQGNTRRLFAQPAHPATRGLLRHLRPMPVAAQAETGAPVLRLENLSHRVQGRCLLDGIRLHLRAGETCAIYGASGAGKSTLARLIAGWLPLPPGQRACDGAVALIPQHPLTACAAHMTVERIVGEPLRLQGPGEQAIGDAVRQALRAVRLPHDDAFLRKRPPQLSGGELQRVTLARALTRMPGVLVADEPTSALDPANRQNLLHLLARLQRRHGFALLVFTHDPLVAQVLRCRTLRLEHGMLHPAGDGTGAL